MVGAVSWGFMPPLRKAHVLPRLARLAGTLNFRCAAHEYRLAATGGAHLLVYNRLMPWDHAAGVLLHAEAGGHARRFDGSAYTALTHDGGLICAPDEASWEAAREALLDGPTNFAGLLPEVADMFDYPDARPLRDGSTMAAPPHLARLIEERRARAATRSGASPPDGRNPSPRSPKDPRREVDALTGAVLGGAGDEGGGQAGGAGGAEVAIVGGDEADLVALHGQDLGGALVGLGLRLVGLHRLGTEDGVPGQAGALPHRGEEVDVAVGERGQEEPAAQAVQAEQHVRPRVQLVPGEVERVEVGGFAAGDAVVGQHGFQVFAVQEIEAGEGAAAAAALLHAGLVAAAPGIGEGEGVEVGAADGGQEGSQLAGDAGAPVHHGAEDVEDESADLLHHFGSTAHLRSNSQISGKPIRVQMRSKP
jgi:hypothetical protein